MTLNVALHDPTSTFVNRFTHDGKPCASITFTDDKGHNVRLFVPPVVATALAEAFMEATARHEAGQAAVYRAREMNAELPEDVREVMQLKGMI